MEEMRDVLAIVTSQRGTCSAGHKAGDRFIIGQTTPADMCSWAFCALFPFITVLQMGCSFPWENEQGRTTVACPDPDNPVVFELRRAD